MLEARRLLSNVLSKWLKSGENPTCTRCGKQFKVGEMYYRSSSCKSRYCAECCSTLWINIDSSEEDSLVWE